MGEKSLRARRRLTVCKGTKRRVNFATTPRAGIDKWTHQYRPLRARQRKIPLKLNRNNLDAAKSSALLSIRAFSRQWLKIGGRVDFCNSQRANLGLAVADFSARAKDLTSSLAARPRNHGARAADVGEDV